MDQVRHVVLLMLENHSFDEMLGCFQRDYADLDGVDPDAPPRTNPDLDGSPVPQKPKGAYTMPLDPKHELDNVLAQLEGGNQGFVKDFVRRFPRSTARDHALVMGYCEQGFLPALHALAEDFTICDRWFSSLPGPTWPNRLFALSGTSSGRVHMPESLLKPHLGTIRDQTQPTVFDRLNEKGKSWKIYYYDFPSSLLFANQRASVNLANYYTINRFFGRDVRGPAESFPDFVFIEPKYFGIDENDDHPPHNILKAEKLVADVYNAIRANHDLWMSTLLVVAFDEHGGFYDHVSPPAAVPPDGKKTEYDFTRLGPRVPALLVSPWVDRRVDHTVYDHTSVLRYLVDKWGLGPLGARTASANSIGSALTRTSPREEQDTIGFIRVPFGQMLKDDGGGLDPAPTGHHGAIEVLAAYLKNELEGAADAALSAPVRVASWWTRTKAWLAETLFLPAGNALIASHLDAEAEKIRETTAVADRLLRRGEAFETPEGQVR